MTRIWWILIRALKSLKNLHFDWSLLCKVYNVWPKKVQRSYISWHWRVMQNLKKNWLVVWKWHEEFGKFSSEHLKMSKLVFSWDPFVQSRKCMSYNFKEELEVTTLNDDEEELTCRFKTDRSSRQRCSVKNVFIEISQNSQESTCAIVSFLIKLQVSGLQLC